MNFKKLFRLYKKGWALHWIKKNSKVPVQPGWTTGPRTKWDRLKKEYREGLNVGVRLGEASRLKKGYLAVVDLDIKSKKRRHAREAVRALFKRFPQCRTTASVLSGRGNGSAHYYVWVKKPLRGNETKGKSKEIVKVFMPSVPASKKERRILSTEELKKGLRLRPAWEVSLLSEGRQVVLPPSLHPDTGRAYRWQRGVECGVPLVRSTTALEPSKSAASNEPEVSTFEMVELDSLGLREEQVEAIRSGEGVIDRSAECFALSMALLSRGVTDNTILSLFTDRRFYLGETAYDHAKTKNRRRAAEWFSKYCLRNAKKKIAESPFDIEIKEPEEWVDEDPDWKKKLDRTKDKDKRLRGTFNNVLLLLEKTVSPEILKRNAFANEDVFQVRTPWGNRPGEKRSGNADNALAVKEWLIDSYKLEAQVKTIDEVLNRIAARNSFHPVKDFLDKLEWDGTDRIETAFRTYLTAKMPPVYLRAVSVKFFMALISRIYQPGCKFDHLPVFEGAQGIGKSSFGRILVGDEWFLDQLPDLNDKDAALNLQGIWICEMSELSSLYRSQLETAKGFIARQTDKVRPPYGHRRVDFPRSCVFYGTTNQRDYLTDTTGNRRFWPVYVKGCDFDSLRKDRLQLLAEAKFLYDFCGEPLYLSGEAERQAKAIQESRRVESEYDSMEAKFLDWLKLDAADRALPDIRLVRLEELFDNGPFTSFQKTHGNRIYAAMVLRKAGYRKKHTEYGNFWKCA